MQFLKRLFGGSQSHLVIYVRPKMCQKILPLTIDLKNQLSLNDTEDGYFVRKVANEPRCPFEVEVTLYFDKKKRLINQEITNGEFVTEDTYLESVRTG